MNIRPSSEALGAEPAKATMLQALELPGMGSETRCCNMHAAYDDLTPKTKARLDGLTAVHVYDTPRWQGADSERTAAERVLTPNVDHPVGARRVHQRLLLAGGRPLGAAAAATN